MKQLFSKLPFPTLILLCATLGLAPFTPPHIIEKLSLLVHLNLVKPTDYFDLLLHGTPWALLIIKVTLLLLDKMQTTKPS